jgi:hypothetical protein
VAQKLNSEFGYSYDNLKVLLGGWSTWKQKHAEDATGYPTEPEILDGGAVPGGEILLSPVPVTTP